MIFKDYMDTGLVYHIVTITDLKSVLTKGLQYNDKATYQSKYCKFHQYFDDKKNSAIPPWVQRSRAIFSSMNFEEGHQWHSHSAILGLHIKEDLCWICNENIANFLYEPLMLQDTPGFEEAALFISRYGEKAAKDYWSCSLSFKENLIARNDKKAGYDAEVLILHDIPPEDIELLSIASDHRYMEVNKWKEAFHKNELNYSKC